MPNITYCRANYVEVPQKNQQMAKKKCMASQMKDWYRVAIAAISDWPRLFHDANLLSGTAENRAVCLGL